MPKTALVVIVFLFIFGLDPLSASAELFKPFPSSGVGNVTIKTANYNATTGANTFDVVSGFEFEDNGNIASGRLWEQLYQRVEEGTPVLYYGPKKTGGTFIIRTYESDKDGHPIKPPDTDNNPEDTLITIVPQEVRYADSSTALNLFLLSSPLTAGTAQGNNATTNALGQLATDSTVILNQFFKYPKGTSSDRAGRSEVIRSEVKTKNLIRPGHFVGIDLWYCAETGYVGDSSISVTGGTNSNFVDNSPGVVIDATTQSIDGVTKLKSSPILFPDQVDAFNWANEPDHKWTNSDDAPPCVTYINRDGEHAEKYLTGDDFVYKIVPGTYFRIGNKTQVYQIPASADANEEAQKDTSSGLTTKNKSELQKGFLPSCGVFDDDSSIMGCVAQGVYYVIYVPIAWIAGLLGNLFDFFMGYSLDDHSYRAEFAVRGWKIVRDISNIFFIIILVWTGLSTVFNTGTNMKKVVPMLILNALLINFSLFGTRVIIDLSNVVARVFYNSMETCKGKCEKDKDGKITNASDTIGGYKQLSVAIVSGFNPQHLMSEDSLKSAQFSPPSAGGAVATIGGNQLSDDTAKTAKEAGASTIAGYFIIVTLIAALIMFGIAMMFWKTAFMFLGRVIGLYVAMIFAPFAVLTHGNMPLVGGIKELGWDSWWKDLSNYAILAPIFIFFLYIIYSFLNTDFLKVTKDSIGNASFFTNVISVAVPMLIIYFMIKQGVDIAKKYAGEIGKKINGAVNGVIAATALGVASGGIASVARGTLGRASSAMANSDTLRKWSGSNNWLARQVGNTGVKIGESGSKANYDIRGTGLAKAVGIDSSKESKFLGRLTRTTTDNTKGGVVASIDRKEKRGYERMKTFQLSGDMAVKQDAKAKAWENANIKTAFDTWKNDPANAHLINDDFSVQQKKAALIATADPNNLRAKSAKEINLQRNKDYGNRVKKESLVTQAAGKIFGAQGAVAGGAGAVGAGVAAGALGGILSAVGGEMHTSGMADARVGGSVGKLTDHENEIARLTGLIGPLQTTSLTPGQILTPAEKAQLDSLKGKLKAETAKRDALSEKLTKKD